MITSQAKGVIIHSWYDAVQRCSNNITSARKSERLFLAGKENA
jgi:hypothetical protein